MSKRRASSIRYSLSVRSRGVMGDVGLLVGESSVPNSTHLPQLPTPHPHHHVTDELRAFRQLQCRTAVQLLFPDVLPVSVFHHRYLPRVDLLPPLAGDGVAEPEDSVEAVVDTLLGLGLEPVGD